MSDVATRSARFFRFMQNLGEFSMMMDRNLFCRELKRFNEFLAQEASAMEFTAAEKREWDGIVQEAMAENNPLKLRMRFGEICKFLDRYYAATANDGDVA